MRSGIAAAQTVSAAIARPAGSAPVNIACPRAYLSITGGKMFAGNSGASNLAQRSTGVGQIGSARLFSSLVMLSPIVARALSRRSPIRRTGNRTSCSPASVAIAGAQSSPHPFEQARPHTPGQYDERIGVISAEEENVVAGEPRLQRDEAGAGFAGLHLRDERGLVGAVGIDVEIVTRAAEAEGTGKRVSLRLDADAYVLDNNLALNAVAFSSVTATAKLSLVTGRALF